MTGVGTGLDANANARLDAGEKVRFTWTVRNDGGTELSAVAVTAAGGTVPCAATTLAPGATTKCNRPVILTQALIDSGRVTMSASASAGDGTSTVTSGASATKSITAVGKLTVTQSTSITRDANANHKADGGDKLTFTFVTANVGNVTLTNVSIVSPLLSDRKRSVVCNETTLAPGVSTTCVAKGYIVRPKDAKAGSIRSIAQASGVTPAGLVKLSPKSNQRIALGSGGSGGPGGPGGPGGSGGPVGKPGLALSMYVAKVFDNYDHNGASDVGDGVLYKFVVRNTGQLGLSRVSIASGRLSKLGISIACPAGSLNVGQSMVCGADAPYLVTRDDFHNAKVTNQASVQATVASSGRVIRAHSELSRPLGVPIRLTVGPFLADGSVLAFTGSDASRTSLIGLWLLLSGVGLVGARRVLALARPSS